MKLSQCWLRRLGHFYYIFHVFIIFFLLEFFINISELPPPSTTINRPYTSLITPTTIRSQREFLIRTIFMTNSNNARKIKMKWSIYVRVRIHNTYMQQIWSKKFNIIYNPSVMFMVNAIITHFVSYTSEINRK